MFFFFLIYTSTENVFASRANAMLNIFVNVLVTVKTLEWTLGIIWDLQVAFASEHVIIL